MMNKSYPTRVSPNYVNAKCPLQYEIWHCAVPSTKYLRDARAVVSHVSFIYVVVKYFPLLEKLQRIICTHSRPQTGSFEQLTQWGIVQVFWWENCFYRKNQNLRIFKTCHRTGSRSKRIEIAAMAFNRLIELSTFILWKFHFWATFVHFRWKEFTLPNTTHFMFVNSAER